MKLPFVSRGRYDDMIASRDDWMQEYRILRSHYDNLLSNVVLMKKEGFMVQPDPNAFIPIPKTVDETDEERAFEERALG